MSQEDHSVPTRPRFIIIITITTIVLVVVAFHKADKATGISIVIENVPGCKGVLLNIYFIYYCSCC